MIAKLKFPIVIVFIAASFIHCQKQETPQAFQKLERSTPEEQGISSDTLISFLEGVQNSGQEWHSVMILRHGKVVMEAFWNPYQPTDKQQLYSLSKSFTSTAIGLAVDEGLLSVDDPVVKFFPEDLPDTLSENLSALKVKHLLSMSVGHSQDAIRLLEASPQGQSWAETFLSLSVVFEPGTQFMYNSGASYMLANIISNVTGQSAHEYLKTRLYEPLNISQATWTTNSEGVNMGASHLRITTEDIAKFGQLYLQKGKWEGKQLLSEHWVTQASQKQIVTGENNHSWGYGYGYQFWMNPPGGFRADGAFGQYGMVFPDQDMVIAITSESNDKAETMQLAWDLVESISDNELLAENYSANDKLQAKIKTLGYNPPKMGSGSAFSEKISGKEYRLDSNAFNAESVSFGFENETVLFTLKTENKPDIVVTCGLNEWVRGENFKPEAHSLFSLRRIDFDSKMAASATWQDENTLLLTWRFTETCHGDQLICRFDEDGLTIDFRYSLARMENRKDGRESLKGSW